MGTDLTFVGSQRTVEFLRESILEPDAFVEPLYSTARIVMENGERYEGLLLNEDTYYVQLLSMQRGLVTVARRNFREYEASKKSQMPSYKGKIGDKDLNDLLAYLWSLQRPGRKP
jgi:quinoprotein glucose dehydrogenase